jgi:hypothetical protein
MKCNEWQAKAHFIAIFGTDNNGSINDDTFSIDTTQNIPKSTQNIEQNECSS